jgi:hypothetical protein
MLLEDFTEVVEALVRKFSSCATPSSAPLRAAAADVPVMRSRTSGRNSHHSGVNVM